MYKTSTNILSIDPHHTYTNGYTNVLWILSLNLIRIVPLFFLACKSRNKAGLPTNSFTFRNYSG